MRLIPMTHPALGDVEEVGQQVGVTAWLKHQQAAVHPASSQRRGKLSQVTLAHPLHHPAHNLQIFQDGTKRET